MEQAKLLELTVAEIKNKTPLVTIPSWSKTGVYQSVLYLATAIKSLQELMFDSAISSTQIRAYLGAIIFLAQEALRRVPE